MEKVEVTGKEKRTGAFTLIELLIVITILAVLVLVVVSKYGGFRNAALKAKAERVINISRQVAVAAQRYYIQHDQVPTMAQLVSEDLLDSEVTFDANGDSTNDLSIDGTNVKFFSDTNGVDLVVRIENVPRKICLAAEDMAKGTVVCDPNTHNIIYYLIVPDIA